MEKTEAGGVICDESGAERPLVIVFVGALK